VGYCGTGCWGAVYCVLCTVLGCWFAGCWVLGCWGVGVVGWGTGVLGGGVLVLGCWGGGVLLGVCACEPPLILETDADDATELQSNSTEKHKTEQCPQSYTLTEQRSTRHSSLSSLDLLCDVLLATKSKTQNPNQRDNL
jgi:hypothetical protein